VLLHDAAQCNGVHPSLSAKLISQPNSTKNLTHSKFDAHTALCNAVKPSSFG